MKNGKKQQYYGVISTLARYKGMRPGRTPDENEGNFHGIEHYGTKESSKAYIKKMKGYERAQFYSSPETKGEKWRNWGHWNYQTIRLTKKEVEHAKKYNKFDIKAINKAKLG